MATSREEIKKWAQEGKREGATHMIVVCDTFDWSDYPVYVSKKEKVKKIEAQYDDKNMQRVMEVYNLGMDLDEQLSQTRSFNY